MRNEEIKPLLTLEQGFDAIKRLQRGPPAPPQ